MGNGDLGAGLINIQIVLRTAESGAFMFLWEVAPGASRHPIPFGVLPATAGAIIART
jgi:hypothetical protein